MSRRCPKCATQWPDDLSTCPHDAEPLPEPTAQDGGAAENLDLVEAYGCEPGDTLGQYRLLRLLGIGGMAAVFEGEHTVIGQPVAVKVMHRELHDSPVDVRRFFHEARAITELEHPGIVECLDYVDGTADTPPYLVMELLSGQTLDEVIKERAPLPLAETVAIISQICDAMAATHAKGILHRDLKPSNIMISELPSSTTDQPPVGEHAPLVKLLDFGVAKFLVTDEHFLRTATGAVLGTPEYMAPEVVRGQTLSPATDVYALGGVLYQLLTGRLPFVCDTMGQLIHHHLRVPAESPSKVAPEPYASQIPSSLDKLVLGCLAKSPEHRISTMSDLKSRLRRIASGDDTDLVSIPADLPPLPARRSPLVWVGSGLLAAGMVALGLWWLAGSPTDQPRRKTERLLALRATQKTRDASAPKRIPERVRPRPRPVVVRTRLTSRPAGASAFRSDDGQFLGKTPLFVVVPPPGVLRVVLRLAGHLDTRIEVRHRPETPWVALLLPKVKPRPLLRARGQPPPPHRPVMIRPGMNVTWGTVDPFNMKP